MLTWNFILTCRPHLEKTPRMVLHRGIVCQTTHPLRHQPLRLTALASHQSHRHRQQAHQVQLSLKLVSINFQSYSTIVIAWFFRVVAYDQTRFSFYFLCSFFIGKCKTKHVEINLCPSPIWWTVTTPVRESKNIKSVYKPW